MKNCELAELGLRGAGHAERAALERRRGEFGLEVGQLGAAAAGAGRIAGLGHEAVDHAVEHDAVVEMLADQRLDLRHVVRREVGPQLDRDPAVLGVEIDRIVVDLALRRGGVDPIRRGGRSRKQKVAPAECIVTLVGCVAWCPCT